MTWLLEEDNALKQHLSNPTITVADDQRSSRPVEVWFGQPDLELQKRTYPYISLELIDINEAPERVVNGLPMLTYTPSGYAPLPAGQVRYVNMFPTPYDLDYQVTVWSRHPRHDRQILQQLMQGRLPIRFGQLALAETNRVVRLDMLGGPRVADTTDENGKRLFRKVFTLRVATELFPENALKAAGLVRAVHITEPSVFDPDFTPIVATIGSGYGYAKYDEAVYS